MERPVEVSFVMPCLDEAETLAGCIQAARGLIERHSLDAEIVIADNGSTDGSQEIARSEGARVVDVPAQGYGAALQGGFEAARGKYLIMADADLSYDFGEAMPMVEALRAGADVVMGSRLKGRIEPGAMPFLHRWLGNPVLSFLGRFLFRTGISDFHCGLRGLTKKSFQALNLRTTGKELEVGKDPGIHLFLVSLEGPIESRRRLWIVRLLAVAIEVHGKGGVTELGEHIGSHADVVIVPPPLRGDENPGVGARSFGQGKVGSGHNTACG